MAAEESCLSIRQQDLPIGTRGWQNGEDRSTGANPSQIDHQPDMGSRQQIMRLPKQFSGHTQWRNNACPESRIKANPCPVSLRL
jgi:hypothetical protein